MDRGGKNMDCENLKATRQSYGEKLAETTPYKITEPANLNILEPIP